MVDELDPGSTAPTGTSPAGSNLHDWNTGLAGPAPDAGSVSGAADTRFGGEGKPEWRDPSEIPGGAARVHRRLR
ncbi:hypothetical protein RCH12_001194 [Cryobacterium sp. MP_3.1]|uniref:hypothetical protein n=1 Tax=Cryobacterium sp. MP_3.1 TaxID=3071711 RepID=UPI002E0C99D7|nr:hypothetical protein [Cryobacterium sp. MP_3.1]